MRTALALVAAATIVGLAAGCGRGFHGAQSLREAKPPVARRLMERRLDAEQLDYKWVACVLVGRTFEHVPITRCNVNFGIDPHIEGYCVLLRNGTLTTNHEDASIPCKHDDAGWDRTTITSSQ